MSPRPMAVVRRVRSRSGPDGHAVYGVSRMALSAADLGITWVGNSVEQRPGPTPGRRSVRASTAAPARLRPSLGAARPPSKAYVPDLARVDRDRVISFGITVV